VNNRFYTHGNKFVSSAGTSCVNARSLRNSMEFMRW
jgi:hypothetical protein